MFVLLGVVIGRLEDNLRQASMADPLTWLANRRLFDKMLSHEIAQAQRTGAPLSVLVMDVDRLKRINDEGGHAAGDRALRAVGTALRRACRRADLPARIGGDEFAVVALGARDAEALALAERIRGALAEDPCGVRVSIGIASIGSFAAQDAARLLEAADDALMEGKARGRDTIVVARTPGAPGEG